MSARRNNFGRSLLAAQTPNESQKRILELKKELFGDNNRKKEPVPRKQSPILQKSVLPVSKPGGLGLSQQRHLPSSRGNFSFEYVLRNDSLKSSEADSIFAQTPQGSRINSNSKITEPTRNILPELNAGIQVERRERPSQPQKPIKAIEIILSEDQKDTLPIFADSDPLKVAQDFCKRWELEEDETILRVISSTIQEEKESQGFRDSFGSSSRGPSTTGSDSNFQRESESSQSSQPKTKKPIFSKETPNSYGNISKNENKSLISKSKGEQRGNSSIYDSGRSKALNRQSEFIIPIPTLENQADTSEFEQNGPECFGRVDHIQKNSQSFFSPIISFPNNKRESKGLMESKAFSSNGFEYLSVESSILSEKPKEESFQSPDFTRNFDISRDSDILTLEENGGCNRSRHSKPKTQPKEDSPEFNEHMSFGAPLKSHEECVGVLSGLDSDSFRRQWNWENQNSFRQTDGKTSFKSSRNSKTKVEAYGEHRKYEISKVARIFDILDWDKDGRISHSSLKLPFKLEQDHHELLLDILSSHTEESMNLTEFFELLIAISQYEALISIFHWLF